MTTRRDPLARLRRRSTRTTSSWPLSPSRRTLTLHPRARLATTAQTLKTTTTKRPPRQRRRRPPPPPSLSSRPPRSVPSSVPSATRRRLRRQRIWPRRRRGRAPAWRLLLRSGGLRNTKRVSVPSVRTRRRPRQKSMVSLLSAGRAVVVARRRVPGRQAPRVATREEARRGTRARPTTNRCDSDICLFMIVVVHNIVIVVSCGSYLGHFYAVGQHASAFFCVVECGYGCCLS